MQDHLTASEAAPLMGLTDEGLRNKTKRDETPWTEEGRVAGTHRRYGVFHLVAYAAGEMMVSQGLNWQQTAESVGSVEAKIRDFVEQHGPDEALEKTFILSERQQVFDEFTDSFRWEPVFPATFGSLAEIEVAISADLGKIGTARKRSAPESGNYMVRTIMWHFAPICLDEAYGMAKARAKHHGYLIEGDKISKIAAPTEAKDA